MHYPYSSKKQKKNNIKNNSINNYALCIMNFALIKIMHYEL